MDPKQGLCLGALFDIAATNVSRFLFSGFGTFFLLLVLTIYRMRIVFGSFRDLMLADGFVSLDFVVQLRC